VLVGVPGLGGEFVRDVRDEREDRVKTFVSDALDAVVVRLALGMSSGESRELGAYWSIMSSLELLRKKVLAFFRNVGRPASLGEGGLEPFGVLVAEEEFVALRESVRSGTDLGGNAVATAVGMRSRGFAGCFGRGEGVASGVGGL